MPAKNEIRKNIKLLFSQNKEGLARESSLICSRILASEQYKNAHQIFAYMALWDEVDLTAVIKAALTDGKKVALPKITDLEKGLMKFYYLNSSLTDTLINQTKKGSLGIEEPDETLLEIAGSDLAADTLILVPGRAFTKKGDRLGRGKGFYDIFLSGLEERKKDGVQITKAGVCFSFQLVDSIPVTAGDIRMDFIF